MLAKKKKLSRKEIKEDKLVTFYYKAYEYIEQNRQRLIMYAGIVIVVAAAVFFYVQNKKSRNEDANVYLSRVMSLYDQGSYLEAIEGRAGTNIWGLKKIVEEYGSTENGETAKIYLANSYYMLGKFDQAFKFYDDYSGSIEIYKATALAGEAAYHASKKEYEKAADLYREASGVKEGNVMNADYLLRAGINYMNAGKNDKAKEQFEKIKEDYKTSPAMREVESYLQQVS